MWTVRFTDDQREAISLLIRTAEELPGDDLKGMLEALEFARWDELPEAHLPWDRVGELAKEQGIDEADVVWDLAGGLPSRPKRTPVSRRHKVATKRV